MLIIQALYSNSDLVNNDTFLSYLTLKKFYKIPIGTVKGNKLIPCISDHYTTWLISQKQLKCNLDLFIKIQAHNCWNIVESGLSHLIIHIIINAIYIMYTLLISSANTANPIVFKAAINVFQLASVLLLVQYLNISVQHVSTSLGLLSLIASNLSGPSLSSSCTPKSYHFLPIFRTYMFKSFKSGGSVEPLIKMQH